MNERRFELLRRNKFYLFWCRFLVDLNALNAVVQLFYLHRGLTNPQIYLLGIAFSVGILLFDIPSSYVADKWGRKNTILIGVIVNVLANGYLFFAQGFWPFFIDTFILAISYAFFFGVEDAFLYDNAKEMKQEGVVIKTAGKYASAGRLSKILTPIIGIFIAKNLTTYEFNILLAINLVSSVFAVIFALLLVEPKRFSSKLESELNIFGEGLKSFWNSDSLRTFAVNKTFIFISSFIFWRYYQSALYNLGFPVLLLGLIYPISNIFLVSIFVFAPKISEKVNYTNIFNSVSWATLISSVAILVTDNWVIVFISSVVLLTVATIRDPFFFQQIHYRLKSFNRATTSSILGIFKYACDVPILLLSSYLATLGGKSVMVLPIIVSIFMIVFFRIKPEFIVKSYVKE